MHLLVDLGGTNTRLGLADRTGLLDDTLHKHPNADYPGLAEVIYAYLDDLRPGAICGLCAGVAGPVRGQSARLTNYNWLIEADALCRATNATEVHLINDLQAQGYALDDLVPGDIVPLRKCEPPREGATRAVLNLGTGCNIAVVHSFGDVLHVPAAESGHSNLPFLSGRLAILFEHLGKAHPHLPIEAALSGPGLSNIHAWMTGRQDAPQAIIDAAGQGAADALETVSLFVETLGCVAGNFALHHLPMGGLYLSGSLSRAIAPFLSDPVFLKSFDARGPYSDLVSGIPISVIDRDAFALLGCYRYLRQVLDNK